MSNDNLFADIIVNLHPDGSFDSRNKLEEELRALSGVFSVHFDFEESRHTVYVAYNPRVVTSDELLETIRQSYSDAERTAKILMSAGS